MKHWRPSPARTRMGLLAALFLVPIVVWGVFLHERTDPRLPAGTRIPTVRGKPEACLSCHSNYSGFAPGHDPARIGCSSCHQGDPTSLNARIAHGGMSRVPGNLKGIAASCGSSECHADIATRVNRSLMNTMSGVVAVDRWVFGETGSPELPHDIRHLGGTPAERHLRQLCASCHLGTPKTGPGPVTEESRGGGCSACHLRYDRQALQSLEQRGTPFPAGRELRHPDISLKLAPEACLGCHSRSGRISLGYGGWHEGEQPTRTPSVELTPARRTLLDGRELTRMPADIHQEKGLICIDCHGAQEVMGDGVAYLHEEEARRSSCVDCHPASPPAAVGLESLDPETRSILRLRGREKPGLRYLMGIRGQAYSNLTVEEGRLVLTGKEDGRRHEARPMPATCGGRDPAHGRLSCDSCHASWAPQCISCHTKEDPREPGWDLLLDRETKGTWIERSGAQHADRPVLGLLRDARDPGEKPPRIGVFVPGMILHLQNPERTKTDFRRLYAPTSPHTTRSQARSCEECHLEPLALGYGRGRLDYTVSGGHGSWRFMPELPRLPEDGLPEDAWIPFLSEAGPGRSTREAASPLGLPEQKRILTVGACLSCHKSTDTAFRRRLLDFPAALAGRGPDCILPDWQGR